jgi:PQQ-dependent catabolism-associated CXXCW motif protein
MRVMLGIAIMLAGAAASAPASAPLFDAAGYRVARYRTVVDRSPPGVARIGARAVARLVAQNAAILVDVMLTEGGHFDPATGKWRLAAPRASLPGAHWFPETGRGDVSPRLAAWLVGRVSALAAARPRATVVVFCLADCWMSWNAALRLRRAGVRRVRWYADGTDGWRDLGRELVEVAPERGL